MICSRCGAQVEELKGFCGHCGTPLPWTCRCGSENPADKRFCGDCGAARGGPQEPTRASFERHEPERRQLTALFADLVGSTALGTRLDPEDMRSVVRAFFDVANGLAARFGGFVARYMGDGVLIYFGYPQSHEDDAERAICAGLAIAQAVSHLETAAGPGGVLRARVGIATGTVVVGDLIGAGSSLESAVVGQAPNLAARLQGLARPGAVVVGDFTRRLAGGLFEYEELEPAVVKGFDEPLKAWTVRRESAIDSRFEALRPGGLPLIGRTEEVALLMRRWESARSGQGSVVVLSGEAGIGKSRLIAALEENLAEKSYLRLRLLCAPHYQDAPLYPLIRCIERGARFGHDDPVETKRDKLGRALAQLDGSSRDAALVTDLLSVSATTDTFLAGDLSPRQKREMTFTAVLNYLERLAKQKPLLLIVEDVHWADPTTLELLDQLVHIGDRLPLLGIVTTRPELKPTWSSRPHVTTLVLSGLNRRDATSLIRKMSGTQALTDAIIERILARSDSVPLYIEELTRAVLEIENLQTAGDSATTAAQRSADIVPPSLQASLMARLDRFPAGKEAAQIGAVVGREFSIQMLRSASDLPIDRLNYEVEQLVEAGIIIARGEPPDSIYAFKHALLQDAAYASLLRDKRRKIHLRCAEALESGTSGALQPQLIASHFAEGGMPERSIQYYLVAAEQATGRFALAEMVSQLRKALRQIEYLPQSRERQRRELDLQVAVGRALIDHRGSASDEAHDAFGRARELSLELRDIASFLRVQDGLVNYHFSRSEPSKMMGYAIEMFDLAKSADNPQVLFMARRAAGYANFLLGDLAKAREDLETLISSYDVDRDGPKAGLTNRDPKVSACTALGICLTVMGDVESGTKITLQGLTHAENLNHRVSLILGLRRACIQRIIARDTAGALEISDRLFSLSTEYETFKGGRDGMICRCWAHLQSRKDALLIEQMQTCIEQLYVTRHWALLPFFIGLTAETIGGFGNRSGAVALLERALELVNMTGEQWCEPEILRLQALLGPADAAHSVSLLEESIAKSREQGAKLWEARAAGSLAETLHKEGKSAAARDLPGSLSEASGPATQRTP